MKIKDKILGLSFIFLSVIVLVSKRYYTGPYVEFVQSYFGNISISFAVYFILSFSADKWKMNKFITAAFALAVVELFEVSNGFGIMSNTFDPFDLIANLFGVGLALGIDLLINKIKSTKSN